MHKEEIKTIQLKKLKKLEEYNYQIPFGSQIDKPQGFFVWYMDGFCFLVYWIC